MNAHKNIRKLYVVVIVWIVLNVVAFMIGYHFGR